MRALLAAFLLFCFTGPAWAAASDPAGTERVQVRFLSDVAAVSPGETFTLALEQRIIPKWHTYWLNPGDSGLPTEIDWTLPAGATAGAIQWPYPERFDVGPITNYGYSDQVVLLNQITVPADLQPGDSFPIRAHVRWLVCEEICIPEETNLSMVLPVAAPPAPSDYHESLEATRALLPVASPWESQVALNGQELTLTLALPEAAQDQVVSAQFFPDAWGQVIHSGKQEVFRGAQGLSLVMEPEVGFDPIQQPLSGVLVLTDSLDDGQTVTRALSLEVLADASGAAVAPAGGGSAGGVGISLAGDAGAAFAEIGFFTALLFAFLGGLILNLMPCVFPVLSIKILSLAQQVGGERRVMRHHGLVYTAGVLVSFAALAGLLLVLRAGGEALGWGFQFQSPTFVLLMALLFFALGLMLSGAFTFGASWIGVGDRLTQKPGMGGSFFTGVLATLAATPCTAPFMGAAVGFAVAASGVTAIAVFLALGLGLATPYLLLTLFPGALSWLPKPGVWMDRLKQAMAFPLYAAAIWLVWVLAQQSGAQGVLAVLAAMLLLAFAAWLFQTTRALGRGGRMVATVSVVLVLAASVLAAPRLLPSASAGGPITALKDGLVPSEPFSPARLAELRDEGRTVFVNFTAAWCITCLVNEEVAFTDPAVAKAFKAGNVVYLKADWTNRDPVITEALAAQGRSGVPLYLLYPRDGGSPEVLPQILTAGSVIQALTAVTQTSQSAELDTQ
ncbi:MAG: protein-disulfide reductase DsbD domain-containing protein [Pseudomonadota bacterium]